MLPICDYDSVTEHCRPRDRQVTVLEFGGGTSTDHTRIREQQGAALKQLEAIHVKIGEASKLAHSQQLMGGDHPMFEHFNAAVVHLSQALQELEAAAEALIGQTR